MNRLLPLLVFFAFLVASCATVGTDSREGVVRHVVLFQFQEGATADQIASIETAFGELPAQVPEILDFEWGTDIGVENLGKGFTHCFLVTFENEAARDAYLPHPAHQGFVELLGPILEDVLVVDYHVRK